MGNENYSVTSYADKRYYLDGPFLSGGSSLADTVAKFNDIKMDLYNAMYDEKYLGKGPLMEVAYSKYLKQKYKISDYYCAALYSEVAALLKSQKEAFRLNLKAKEADLEARREKISFTEETLEKKRQCKQSIVHFAKTGAWEKPYPASRILVEDGQVFAFRKEPVSLDGFERSVEADIRKLKTRLRLLKEALKRAEARFEKLEAAGVRRVLFGGKALYKKKDAPGADMDGWRKEFREKRHSSMSLPGRYTSRHCNFLCKYNPARKVLEVTCMDGKAAVLSGFALARFQDSLEAELAAKPGQREALCYNFILKRDRHGRQYFNVSVTLQPGWVLEENPSVGFDGGCVAMDMNVDHIVLTDIGRDGEWLGNHTIRFSLAGKPSGEVTGIIGHAMAEAGAYCKDKGKCLVIEDIDTTAAKNGLRYGNRKVNRSMVSFAYRKMTASAISQGFWQGFTVYAIDPAYTSVAGKILYMRRLGLSIHAAASYVIGLAAMGFMDRCAPPKDVMGLMPKAGMAAKRPSKKKPPAKKVPGPRKEAAPGREKRKIEKPKEEFYKADRAHVFVKLGHSIRKEHGRAWAAVAKRTKGIRTHAFYGQVSDADWEGRKRKTMKSYFTILREKDERLLAATRKETTYTAA